MTAEDVQSGFASDGNGIVLFASAIADPTAPTVAEIAAATPITYGLTPDGFNHQTTINTITTGRYTLAQALELDGTVQDTVEIKYVYDRETPTDVEGAVGTVGTTGFLIHSLGYESGHEFVADDVINAIIPIKTSIPRDVPPTANTEAAKILKCNVTGTVQREVAVVS